MKKRSLFCITGLSILLLAGCGQQTAQAQYIGAEQAGQLALAAAGITAEEISTLTADLNTRNGLDYYQVTFTREGQDYEYDVDALTGVIIDAETSSEDQEEAAKADASEAQLQQVREEQEALEKLKEQARQEAEALKEQEALEKLNEQARQEAEALEELKEQVRQEAEILKKEQQNLAKQQEAALAGKQQAAGSEKNLSSSQGQLLTKEKAQETALSHAGLAADQITLLKNQLEWENGKQVYEVEFYTRDYLEYDYDIDAFTGEIISFDYDAENALPSDSSSGTQPLTKEQAQALALEQVPGASAEHIRECETDNDGGRLEYEGKIIYNGMEYEFEIDAYSGAIRNWDAEPVD